MLSELLADLDACDLQKGDAKVLANGEVAPGKFVSIVNRFSSLSPVVSFPVLLTIYFHFVFNRQEDSDKEQNQTDDGCFQSKMAINILRLVIITPNVNSINSNLSFLECNVLQTIVLSVFLHRSRPLSL